MKNGGLRFILRLFDGEGKFDAIASNHLA